MLSIREFEISGLELGSRTELTGGHLIVSRLDLEELVRNEHVEGLELEVVRPDDSIRINGVIDVLEPRAKTVADQVTFPGIATRIRSCGSGTTDALRGIAVTTVGDIAPMSETFIQEDCLIDMAGPGSDYSPFSRLTNLVVRARMAPDTQEDVLMQEMRRVGVELSRHLASLAGSAAPDKVVHYENSPHSRPDAPGRVAYVCSLISEGPLHDTLLYGASTEDIQPTWLPVTHMLDGALVSSDLHYPNQRTPTYLYQRNPIVEAVHSQSGVELLGVILTLRYGSHEDKRAAAISVARMAAEVGADSVIVHPAVGGNAHVDAVDIVEEAEKLDMSAVLVLQEMAGAAGADFGLVHSVPEADALISTGNRDEVIRLAPLDRVIGPDHLKDGRSLKSEVDVSLRSFLCSTSQVGAHRMTTVAG